LVGSDSGQSVHVYPQTVVSVSVGQVQSGYNHHCIESNLFSSSLI